MPMPNPYSGQGKREDQTLWTFDWCQDWGASINVIQWEIRLESAYWILHTSHSLVAQTVKRLPAMRETGVRAPVWEDMLEKEIATHSSTLA